MFLASRCLGTTISKQHLRFSYLRLVVPVFRGNQVQLSFFHATCSDWSKQDKNQFLNIEKSRRLKMSEESVTTTLTKDEAKNTSEGLEKDELADVSV